MKKLLITLGLLSFAFNAHAQTLVFASNPQAILQIAQGLGDAKLDKDREGDPKITGNLEGSAYQILFFGCTNHVHCDNIEFQAGWTDTKATLQEVNRWNRDKRFGKAYLDSANDPMLELDVNLDYGVSRKNLEDTFDYWRKVLRSFKHDVLNH